MPQMKDPKLNISKNVCSLCSLSLTHTLSLSLSQECCDAANTCCREGLFGTGGVVVRQWSRSQCARQSKVFLFVLFPSLFLSFSLVVGVLNCFSTSCYIYFLTNKQRSVTPLGWAVYKDNLDMVKLLLKAGADVNVQNSKVSGININMHRLLSS
jgi:hypothetical protein